jgi:sugar lactone lactonase YvrE
VYVARTPADYARLTVRVSLGLKGRMERTLFWSPHKRICAPSLYPVRMCAAPEGVYVLDCGFGEQLRLFDHSGDYLRTIYPLPHAKLGQVGGLRMHPASGPGRPMPLKWNRDQATYLTMVYFSYGSVWPGKKGSRTKGGNSGYGAAYHTSALAVAPAKRNGDSGKRLAVGFFRLNRLASDGSSAGLPLDGPELWLPAPLQWSGGMNMEFARTPHTSSILPKGGWKSGTVPTQFAFSPDGKWLYATGHWFSDKHRGRYSTLPGVVRMDYAKNDRPQCWVGEMTAGQGGSGPKQLRCPLDVAVDPQGRVYVCDYANDRVQVFSPEGKLLKSLKTPAPARIEVSPRTGECVVLSWNTHYSDRGWKKRRKVADRLTRYGAYPEFKQGTSCALPSIRQTGDKREFAVDWWADPPTLWSLTMGQYSSGKMNTRAAHNVCVYAIGGGKLTLKCDFNQKAGDKCALITPPYEGRIRVDADPKRGHVYVDVGGIGFKVPLVRIDPETGREQVVSPPFGASDLVFDLQGHAYLRSQRTVVRYDISNPGQWREVPFDYGEEQSMGFWGRNYRSVSALTFPASGSGAQQRFGGFDVSPRGNIAVATMLGLALNSGRKDERALALAARKYQPPVAPGRVGGHLVFIFDKHGKLVHEDAFRGVIRIDSVRLDNQDNVYVQVPGHPLVNGRTPKGTNPAACTLFKAKPGKLLFFKKKGLGANLPADRVPKRPPDFRMNSSTAVWVRGAEWMHSGVGVRTDGHALSDCGCTANARFDLDYYARSFASEVHRYQIAVLDTNGNLITRIGRCGNVDDGMPLVKEGGPPNPRSIGGDEVAIMNCLQVAVHTDRRLFIGDIGNYCVRSVKLGYQTEERVRLE